MQKEFLTSLLSFEWVTQMAVILLMGTPIFFLFRWLQKKITPSEEEKPRGIKNFFLQIMVSVVFPGILALGLGLSLAIFRATSEPSGLVDAAIPLLLFSMLYQILSVCVSFLLPKRRFTNMVIRIGLAVGIFILAIRFMGWYEQAMEVVNFPLVVLGPVSISFSLILKVLILGFILFFGVSQFTSFIETRILKKIGLDPNLSFAVMRFFKFFVIGIGFLVALDTLGVNLSTLAIFGGALGIGLGFGLQNITSNLVSGIILLFDRSIKQGDVITVGDSYGWVVKLGARYIVVRTRDGVERLIPNANIISTEITNWSHSDLAVRLKIKVGVSYKSDPFRVRDLLLLVAETNPRVLKYPECRVLFVDFGESSLDFELRVWINDPQEGIESVRSALRFEIWKIFKENAIEIPFPQRDLYIKSGLEGLPHLEIPPSK
ncbi:MAG TPA: mechanosensitive ion channel domain-containing protein [Nitrospiria bacterium]|jgi:small-conductance mechanosensitive channel